MQNTPHKTLSSKQELEFGCKTVHSKDVPRVGIHVRFIDREPMRGWILCGY